jgi:hypothetical protein
MIVVQLIGGLGNQMFQYALGRSLADKHKTSLELDLSWFDDIENDSTKRRYELDCYPIKAQLTDARNLKLTEPGKDKADGLFINKLLGKTPLNLYIEAGPSFHADILNLSNNVYLKGYWQNEKYFEGIRQHLLKEFTPKELSSYTKNTVKKIRDRLSVSLHVRRGDYVNNPLTNKFHGLTAVKYYVNALEHIDAKCDDPQLFVFSDDIKWCQDNLPFAQKAIFVNGNPPDRSCEDMYLMRQCKHNIIANSSFSWWGAWLNENKDKMVVAPKIWFQDKVANRQTQIVTESWIRL